MGRQKLLRTSSVHKFEGSWPAAYLSKDDLRWIRKNLRDDTDTSCSFLKGPQFRRRKAGSILSPVPLLPNDWADRIVYVENQVHPHVLLRMGRRYDLREKLDLAYVKRDPEYAPHVAFQKLLPGNNVMALEFMREFGPLNLSDFDIGANVWVDLNDFWAKNARIIAILRLHKLLENGEALRSALGDLLAKIESLNAAGPAPVGCIPDPQKDQPFPEVIPFSVYQRNQYHLRGRNGDLEWDHTRLRNHARDIIWAELTLQTHDGLRSGWVRVGGEEGLGFRPVRIITSLWAAMWEMFGLETWRGCSWESCKICAKYFYPLQRNSECCSPEHQSLWSKREYARKRRESEKLAASKRHRRTKKNS
jgi:hypothetical protein